MKNATRSENGMQVKKVLPFVNNVLPWLVQQKNSRCSCALVTLIGVDGSSPRPVGSQLAVNADGEYVGQISAGCAEAAIVAEALNCLRSNETKCVRYGKGSPYLDVVLPCGSGIDVHFLPLVSGAVTDRVLKQLTARNAVWISFSLGNINDEFQIVEKSPNQIHLENNCGFLRDGDKFYRRYDPPIRVLAFGRGTIVGSLALFATALDMEVAAYSPDESTLEYAKAMGARTYHYLTSPENTGLLPTDHRTAAVLLFHDHDWEPPILQKLLATDCFYIGALGSQKTHRQRLELLEALGVPRQEHERIHGPVGLNTRASTPPEIAMSITAQIVQFAADSQDIGYNKSRLKKVQDTAPLENDLAHLTG